MRGLPLLRAFVAFSILLLLGWPLWRLTREAAAQPVPVTPVASAPSPLKEIGLQLTFSPVPASVRIVHLEAALWSADAPAQEMEAALRLPYPDAGVDLRFEIAWPADVTGAMRVRLTDPAGAEHEKTLWGRGETADVLTFP
ncbi:MAG: hypothetical protein V4710_22590 [Verrucomicrobiota bacterium]